MRTPSPGPLLSAELSTIIEADSSGVSRHLPMLSAINDTSSDTYTLPSGSYTTPFPDTPVIVQPPQTSASEYYTDISALKLSTEDLASEVRDALRKSQSSGKQWRAADAAIVIDADDMAGDTTFNLDRGELDSDLAALLNSNGAGPRRPMPVGGQALHAPRRFGTSSQTPSPTTPTFPSNVSSPSSTHLSRARQASSLLPRLRPSIHGGSSSNSPSPTSAGFALASPTGPGYISPSTPRASPARPRLSTAGAIAVNGYDYHRTNGSNPSLPSASPPPTKVTTSVVSSTPTHAPPSARRMSTLGKPVRLFGSAATPTAKEPVLNVNSTPSTSTRQPPSRTLRQVMMGVPKSTGEGDGNGNTKTPTPATYSADRKGASGVPATPTVGSSAAILSRQSLDLPRRPFGGSATDLGLGRPSLDVPMRSGGYIQSHPSGQSPRRSLEGRRPMTEHELMGGIPATGIRRATTPTPVPAPISRKVSGSASPERPPTILPSDESSSPSPGTQERRGGTTGYGQGKHGHVNGASMDLDAGGRPSFESARPSSRAGAPSRMVREREREELDTQRTVTARARKRSMSVQDRLTNGRTRHSVFGTGGSTASEFGERYSGPRPGSSLSVRTAPGPSSDRSSKRLEWLGPRTAKAFRAAGLLDFEKDRDPGKERDRIDMDREREADRDPGSPFGSTINRFGYNPSVHGRMAFSDVGGSTLTRKGSESYSAYGGGYGHGLMESPTLTTSSRETPKSSLGSTAPTSLHSLETFGYPMSTPRNGSSDPHIVREREHQNELAALKEKHSTETGALLSALSDSQRIAKVLREENGELRMRIERMGDAVREGEGLMRTLNELKEENEALRRELTAALASSSGSGGNGGRQWKGTGGGLTPSWSVGSTTSSASGYRAPATRGGTSPLVRSYTPRIGKHELDEGMHPPLPPTIRVLGDDKFGEEGREEVTGTQLGTFIDHGSQEEDTTFEMDEDRDCADTSMMQGGDDDDVEADLDILPASLSTKPASRHPSLRKRSSDTSSIFPSLPPNMTMLLHDDASTFGGFGSDSQRSSSIDPSLTGRGEVGSGGSKRSSAYSKTHSRGSSKSEERDDTLTRPSMPVGVGIGPGKMSAYQAFIESASSGGVRHPFNQSIGNQSGMSVSPGTDSFSMATGSPGSLFLRPEHEDLLDDLESLDLGTRADLDRQLELALGIRREEDEW